MVEALVLMEACEKDAKLMIVVCNRLLIHPDYAAEFEERFKTREQMVDKMEGFISFQIMRPLKEDDPYVVMTYWESMANFEGWKTSEAFRQQHGQQRRLPPEALLAEPKIEIGEIIQHTLPASS